MFHVYFRAQGAEGVIKGIQFVPRHLSCPALFQPHGACEGRYVLTLLWKTVYASMRLHGESQVVPMQSLPNSIPSSLANDTQDWLKIIPLGNSCEIGVHHKWLFVRWLR